MKNFTKKMLENFIEGQNQRKRLSMIKETIKTLKNGDPHIYIYSIPGLGKTHTINEALTEEGIKYLSIYNNVSMWAFGVSLATIDYLKDDDEEVIIYVDDCTQLFKNNENINIMKNVLDGNRVFHYQKHLSLISQLDDLQQKAVTAHQTPGQMGFKVNTDKMKFIFTSNEKLPYQNESNLSQRKMDLLAIRDRVKPYDFDLKPLVQWGWIIDVALNTNAINEECPKSIVEEASIFMYDNWDNLKTQSVRTIKMMCDDYLKHKNNYKFVWENEYIR